MGVFANAWSSETKKWSGCGANAQERAADWPAGCSTAAPRARDTPRLALLERITLAPRQSLALIEAEGQRLLRRYLAGGRPSFLCP